MSLRYAGFKTERGGETATVGCGDSYPRELGFCGVAEFAALSLDSFCTIFDVSSCDCARQTGTEDRPVLLERAIPEYQRLACFMIRSGFVQACEVSHLTLKGKNDF